MRAGKLPEALTKADLYLATKPRDPQMRFLKGVIQRDAGKTSDAITTFTRLTEDYPELQYSGAPKPSRVPAATSIALRVAHPILLVRR